MIDGALKSGANTVIHGAVMIDINLVSLKSLNEIKVKLQAI